VGKIEGTESAKLKNGGKQRLMMRLKASW